MHGGTHLGRVGARRGLDILVSRFRCGSSEQDGGGMSKRILVVEDQEDNRQILRDLLEASATS